MQNLHLRIARASDDFASFSGTSTVRRCKTPSGAELMEVRNSL